MVDQPPSDAQELWNHLDRSAIIRLCEEWYLINNETFGGALTIPALGLTLNTTQLGHWNPTQRVIRLSRSLVYEQPWHTVVEVLKHEMAHQYVHEVLRVVDETSHGEAFRQVCERFSIDSSAAGLPNTEKDAEEERILERIAKLLALAESANEHEAKNAMAAAQRLMLRHNIDAKEQKKNRHYTYRMLGKGVPRVDSYRYQIGSILGQHFFVETIWVPSYDAKLTKNVTILEVCGTTANVDMADYVFNFLLHTGEHLWVEHKKKEKIKGDKDRRAYLLGVMQGFDESLRQQKKTNQEQGLVWVGDPKLNQYFRTRHRRIRSVGHSGPAHSDAIEHGRDAGRNIVLHRPVGHGPSGETRALPAKK